MFLKMEFLDKNLATASVCSICHSNAEHENMFKYFWSVKKSWFILHHDEQTFSIFQRGDDDDANFGIEPFWGVFGESTKT